MGQGSPNGHNKAPTLNSIQRQKLEEGKPVFLCGGIKIVKNPKTGQL